MMYKSQQPLLATVGYTWFYTRRNSFNPRSQFGVMVSYDICILSSIIFEYVWYFLGWVFQLCQVADLATSIHKNTRFWTYFPYFSMIHMQTLQAQEASRHVVQHQASPSRSALKRKMSSDDMDRGKKASRFFCDVLWPAMFSSHL